MLPAFCMRTSRVQWSTQGLSLVQPMALLSGEKTHSPAERNSAFHGV
jgi:hypothetical protein